MMVILYAVLPPILGFLLDFIFGDPHLRFHPICIIGNYISFLEKRIRKSIPNDERKELHGGIMLVITVCLTVLLITSVIVFISYMISPVLYIAVETVIFYFMIAAKSLKTESMRVYHSLKDGDIEGGRKAVSMIVGRDTQSLDKQGITKAAVETVAENASDGVTAPTLYMVLGGSVLCVLYKAINTMDSMVGYKNDKYLYFGRAAAKLDDVVNYIPARVSSWFMILSAYILGYDGKNAFRIYKRDRYNHASPNSANTEAVCAGALGVQLAGDAYYFGKLYKKPFIGDKQREIETEDIVRANKLMYSMAVLFIVAAVFIKLSLFMLIGG